VLEISGGDPSFRADNGAADPQVSAALEAFAAGRGSEHDAMTALAASRLLVAVVPVGGGEQATEMAMAKLVGLDGRRALPAFTCAAAMRRWQPAARPVPVAAGKVWQAAAEEDCAAVVVDVAGPVPFAVEGARLATLARGQAAPRPWADPDVREIVAAVLATHPSVAKFELGPAGPERDLAVGLTLDDGGAGSAAEGELAAAVGADIMARLGGRLRRGVEIWLG
jgi:hypothetical protein